jgi:hypothetical protein
MGLRNATVWRLATRDLTTTVLTLTITALGAGVGAANDRAPWARKLGSILSMLVGATAVCAVAILVSNDASARA